MGKTCRHIIDLAKDFNKLQSIILKLLSIDYSSIYIYILKNFFSVSQSFLYEEAITENLYNYETINYQKQSAANLIISTKHIICDNYTITQSRFANTNSLPTFKVM